MILTGREPDAKVLEEMVSEAPGPINFTMFLGLFGERLKGTYLVVDENEESAEYSVGREASAATELSVK